MRRIQTAPINLLDIPESTLNGGATARILALDPETGGRTFVMHLPPGWKAGNGRHGEFEYHKLDEETFFLTGAFNFDGWYELHAGDYLNHPGYWIHPSLQTTDTGATLLIKISEAVEFQFEPIPDDWDRTEYLADPSKDRNLRGVTKLRLEDVPWEPVRSQDGDSLGYDARTIYEDADGWVTWQMRVPAGWRGTGERREIDGGDECFLLEGEWDRASGMPLVAQSYYCDADLYVDGGSEESSAVGCLAVRWTRNFPHRLPPIQY